MIECFSNPDWIKPQIDFLLFLQNLREAHFSMFNDLFLSITIIGEFWLPMTICALLYWCIDFKSGMYLFSLSMFNMFFSHLFKSLACVYRPWVLSDKIHPVEKAVALAAGYSFPSGHSAQASALLGGLAFLCRKKIFVSILLVLLVLLVGFSRMWLGVHTPQDVIVGLAIGFSLVFIMNYLFKWAEKNEDRYLYLTILTNIAVIAVVIYICYFIQYPYDYVNGELLVNPLGSKQASIFCYASIAGTMSGAFLCRRYFPFNPKEAKLKNRVLRGVIGAFLVISLTRLCMKFFWGVPCDFKIMYLFTFINGFIITAVYPLIFSKLLKKYL